MDISIEVTGPDASDGLRSLYTLLAGEEDLRSRVELESGVRPVTLGAATEAIAVVLGPGGVCAAVAACVIAWLRQRTSDVVIRVRGQNDHAVEVSARRVRGLDPSQLAELTHQLAGELAELGE